MHQQRLGAAGMLFNPLVAALGERTIAGKMMTALSLSRVDKLLAGRVRPVERYPFKRHFSDHEGLKTG